jgi:hypothetical protein
LHFQKFRSVGLLIADGLPAALLIQPDAQMLLYDAGAQSKALPATHQPGKQPHCTSDMI